ncbi:c-type cytochrome [bacterium SCSIO 12741]|nr:c-type cytochrome [bacterium SCSIO 12741]
MAALLLFLIVLTGSAIKGLLRSDAFKKKLERSNRQSNSNLNALLLLIGLSLPTFGLAMSPAAEATAEATGFVPTNEMILAAFIINLILLYFLYYLRNMLNSLINVDKTEEELAKESKEASERWSKVLTDRVSMEEEGSILMDHDYDGIQELDNNLPPWWKYGFYLSIVFAVIYLFNYHVVGWGDLQHVEYTKDSLKAEIEKAAYLESQAMSVDENTVTYLSDAGALASGESLFQQYCKTCHLDKGQGNIGPNLTDDYWIHGGTINDVFATIKYGAQNGMKSWQDELNPIQMQQVASYVMSLEYVAPPEGKDPQGDLVAPVEEAPAAPVDSTQAEETPVAAADSTATAQVEE